jgi:sensor histidine kinase YesM
VRRYLDEPRQLAALERERELTALRAQNRALDTRLGVLQAQIEPHFLFNTLASVRSLILVDPQSAERTLDALVDYLRATIPRLRDAAVDSTLGQQLEICEHYLKLMQVRMGRLDYAISVEPALSSASFPPLLLISLVENAVKHGIEAKPGPGRITVSARKEHESLVVCVADDGPGLGHAIGSGVGLSNVREQLRVRYGSRATFALTSGVHGGALASISIRESTQPELL